MHQIWSWSEKFIPITSPKICHLFLKHPYEGKNYQKQSCSNFLSLRTSSKQFFGNCINYDLDQRNLHKIWLFPPVVILLWQRYLVNIMLMFPRQRARLKKSTASWFKWYFRKRLIIRQRYCLNFSISKNVTEAIFR